MGAFPKALRQKRKIARSSPTERYVCLESEGNPPPPGQFGSHCKHGGGRVGDGTAKPDARSSRGRCRLATGDSGVVPVAWSGRQHRRSQEESLQCRWVQLLLWRCRQLLRNLRHLLSVGDQLLLRFGPDMLRRRMLRSWGDMYQRSMLSATVSSTRSLGGI